MNMAMRTLASPQRAHPRRSAWSRLRDGISLYLPVMIIGVLALGTIWLVSNTPQIAGNTVSAPTSRTDPDYRMQNFATRTYRADGQLKIEILGDQGRHYPDVDRLEIDGVRIRGYDEANLLTTANARQAVSVQGGEEVELKGNAIVVRDAGRDAQGQMQPRMTFQGEQLKVFPNDDKVASELPVLITRGQDRTTADQLDYDNTTRVIDLKGRVHSVIQPRPAPAAGR